MAAWPPWPMATVQMTALMPMVMPSSVSAVRSLLRASVRSATRTTSLRSMSCSSPQYNSRALEIDGAAALLEFADPLGHGLKAIPLHVQLLKVWQSPETLRNSKPSKAGHEVESPSGHARVGRRTP